MYSDAIPYFEKQAELKPGDAEVFFDLGFVFDELKNYSKAIEYYDKAIVINNEYHKAFVNRGNCKIELGLKDEACNDFKRALELGGTIVKENIDQYCK
ncbi:MAG TPA: tetratricopeptide repeat protein [Mucilaginibacter sp.]|nr:tetratricopeptide repeat protein [Mucilaginibacter sp.]